MLQALAGRLRGEAADETVLKSLLSPATAAGISAVPPATYAAHFVSFLAEHTK